MEKSSSHQILINNDFYEDLNDDWYTSQDHPIALLRAENALRAPWVAQEIAKRLGPSKRVLDIGCGGGLLSNYLASQGHELTGIDISTGSLETAKKYDKSGKVSYMEANACHLPFPDESFDVACAMDLLEHVETPELLIHEASRIIKKGGLFFFHTFNRNLLSYLLAIKGIEWFVSNSPKNLHVYRLFIKPQELKMMFEAKNLQTSLVQGITPVIWHRSFWKLLLRGHVPTDFAFRFCKGLSTGYCGIAIKK